jgi:hypothetical protein
MSVARLILPASFSLLTACACKNAATPDAACTAATGIAVSVKRAYASLQNSDFEASYYRYQAVIRSGER